VLAVRLSDLDGLRVLILGTGREGVAVAEVLAARGIPVTAADDRESEGSAAFASRFGRVLIAPDFGAVGGQFDVLVKSPGISPLHPFVAAALAAGVPVTSGTDLWMSDHAATATGVTGSKGKSTTASLIHHLSRAHGVDATLAGNIGVPLLTAPAAERTIVELSSYQAQSLTTSPDVVVLTSLFPEHLDWHGSEQQYYTDKLNIIAHAPRRVIVNIEDPRLLAEVKRLGTAFEPVGTGGAWALTASDGDEWISHRGEPLMPRSALPLAGRHNALNICLALAAVEAAGTVIDPETTIAALTTFRPLEHRLEPIADATGVKFINDSLSTSPYAAIEALSAYGSPGAVLIVGGQDRGVDYGPLAVRLAEHPVAAVIGLPPSGARILRELSALGVPCELADDMVDAVRRARRLVEPGGAVLLSPAAPSYGVYRDFAHRGEVFRAAIVATRSEPLTSHEGTP
jgi:UDP-N-acetylmuramoylalanine--D-glutamate ligase